MRILEHEVFKAKKTKFYQASTSELFGEKYGKNSFDEKSIMAPKSPYGVSKLYSYWIQKCIEKHTGFMHVMVFCLITKVLEEEKHLSQEK